MPRRKVSLRNLERRLGRIKSYREMLKKYTAETQRLGLSIGRPPPPGRSKEAWWFLPTATRKRLDKERDAGRFGGTPGQAPYWIVQERGMPLVGIREIGYLKEARRQWEAELPVRVGRWIGLYFRGPGYTPKGG